MSEFIDTFGILTILTNIVAGQGLELVIQTHVYPLLLVATIANSSLFWQMWLIMKRKST